LHDETIEPALMVGSFFAKKHQNILSYPTINDWNRLKIPNVGDFTGRATAVLLQQIFVIN